MAVGLKPVAAGLIPSLGAVGRGAVNAIRANPIRAGVGAAGIAGIAAVGVGGYAAFTDASSLYNSRERMAGQFQQEEMFPSDLIQNDASRNFYMSFKFQAYEKRAINNSPFLRSNGTVRIPIPDNIRDNMSVTYGSTSFSGPTGMAVGAGLESLAGSRGLTASAEPTFDNYVSRAASAALDGASGAAVGLADKFAGDAGKAAQAYFGVAVNPYQTVLFEKPEFKSHNFSWKFMPRDASESGTIRNIIRTFQYHMLPGVSEGVGLFFSYPSMVVISLFPSSDFLYRFKPCVIKSVNVNYGAAGAPSFFKTTGAPTTITMSIEMQEIEYWTNNDYSAAAFNDANAIDNFITAENRRAAIAGTTSVARNTGNPGGS